MSTKYELRLPDGDDMKKAIQVGIDLLDSDMTDCGKCYDTMLDTMYGNAGRVGGRRRTYFRSIHERMHYTPGNDFPARMTSAAMESTGYR